MGRPQEHTALSRFDLASREWTSSKLFRDHFAGARMAAIKHQEQRKARYELLKAMFEREYQDSRNYVQGLDAVIAGYENQMQQSAREMLESLGGGS